MSSVNEADIKKWIDTPLIPHLVGDGLRATAAGTFFGKNTSDEDKIGIEIYSDPKNLPTAMGSIINHSQKAAGFIPAFMSADDLGKSFKKYMGQLNDNPFIHLKSSKDTKEEFHNKNYDALIDAVIRLYDGITAEDADKIKTTIADMAKSVFGQSSAERWENLFVESTIDFSSPERPMFRIYSTQLHMVHEQKRKSEVGEQEFTVQTADYEILTELIQANASQLAAIDKKTVGQWIAGNTSPADSTVKLCFTV